MNKGINSRINNKHALQRIRDAEEDIIVCDSMENQQVVDLRFAGTVELEFSEISHKLLIKTEYFYRTSSDAKIAMGNFCKKIRAASDKEFEIIVDNLWNDGVLSPRVEVIGQECSDSDSTDLLADLEQRVSKLESKTSVFDKLG